MYPFRHWSADLLKSMLLKSGNLSNLKSEKNQTFDGGRVGGLGEGGSKAGQESRYYQAVTKDFAVNTSPQPLSLVRFLCGHKK
jgi:hypothetical protein